MGTVVDPKDFGFPQEQYRQARPLHPPTEFMEGGYPQADFSPSPEYEHKFAPRPHWFLRFYRMLRKLIRRRQESAAMREMHNTCKAEILQSNKDRTRVIAETGRHIDEAMENSKKQIAEARDAAAKEVATMAKRIANRDAALDELRQKMDRKVLDLEETIRSRERDIKSYVDLQIPQLKNELQVKRMHIEHLEQLHANKIAMIEMLTALCNQKIVDADSPINESQARAMSQLLRGDMGISHGG